MVARWKVEKEWNVNEDGSPSAVEFSAPPMIFLAGDEIRADVRWDGCVNIWIGDQQMGNHICELGEFIKLLEELREIAVRYFPDESSYYGK